MNNAAYLRHAELGRVDYFIRTSFWKQLKTKNYGIGFVALNIRYRRELKLFHKYRIETRPIFWDDLQLIIEQRFVDPHTSFLHTIIYCKYILTKNGKKVKRSITESLERDGFHIIDFYEKPLIAKRVNEENEHFAAIGNNGSFELTEEKKIADDIEDMSANERNPKLNRNYFDTFECRNAMPCSLKVWMQCLEQSSYESRRKFL